VWQGIPPITRRRAHPRAHAYLLYEVGIGLLLNVLCASLGVIDPLRDVEGHTDGDLEASHLQGQGGVGLNREKQQ
jgi:hypothetical protein